MEMTEQAQKNLLRQLEMDFAKFLKEKNAKGPCLIEVRMTKELVVCNFGCFLTKCEELVTQAGHGEKVYVNRIIAFSQCISDIEEICRRNLIGKVKQVFPCFLPNQDTGCITIILE